MNEWTIKFEQTNERTNRNRTNVLLYVVNSVKSISLKKFINIFNKNKTEQMFNKRKNNQQKENFTWKNLYIYM